VDYVAARRGGGRGGDVVINDGCGGCFRSPRRAELGAGPCDGSVRRSIGALGAIASL
jgi:hypothetical protein